MCVGTVGALWSRQSTRPCREHIITTASHCMSIVILPSSPTQKDDDGIWVHRGAGTWPKHSPESGRLSFPRQKRRSIKSTRDVSSTQHSPGSASLVLYVM